ncbi:hypothetical protein OMW55_01665 [Sphingomonas sp. BN140010]|uniref:Uncharacterized protein n=1 Tax=Sphingomonas arvum TaxID=2992113 RepID=A0ABT3JBR7_9SPHN|nr:hypothetical protein [Sphingomonas sp. BN140010]MCW3796518.1 hypothetical protein [Sphingomonas sp. BN140010]
MAIGTAEPRLCKAEHGRDQPSQDDQRGKSEVTAEFAGEAFPIQLQADLADLLPRGLHRNDHADTGAPIREVGDASRQPDAGPTISGGQSSVAVEGTDPAHLLVDPESRNRLVHGLRVAEVQGGGQRGSKDFCLTPRFGFAQRIVAPIIVDEGANARKNDEDCKSQDQNWSGTPACLIHLNL